MNQNIGIKIKQIFESKQMKLKDFAEEIGVARQNVYRIFEKDSIDTKLLIKISEVLGHNFFQYFKNSKSNGNDDQNRLSLDNHSELEYFKNELNLARKEIDYLKKIIDLMEERTKLLLNQKDSGK